MSERRIKLKDIIEEFRENYKGNPVNHDWKNVDRFFKDNNETMKYYLEIILADYQKSLSSMQFEWSIIGSFFELFTKICLLKKDWGNLGIIFDARSRKYHTFNTCIDLLIEDLKLKLDEKKIGRVREIFDIVLLQRNNSLHNPISMNDHYRLEEMVFELILFLNKFYMIGFSEEIINKINEKMEIGKKQGGMNFEEIDLLEERE